MKLVRFLKNDLPYTKGEIAGFPDRVADRLIELRFADLHGDGKPQPVGQKIPDPFGYSSGFSDASKNRA